MHNTEAQSVTTFSEGTSIEEFTDFLKKEGLRERDCKLLIESKMQFSFVSSFVTFVLCLTHIYFARSLLLHLYETAD